ncbi:MAG: methionine adenosyltransferase [Clostridia bacterium]|nr:methionine adenosyltransferase [Clostridia bacterium]
MNKHFFTSESVTEGHPDKVCDQISDAVLDAILASDPEAHVACETTATTGMVLVMGEITTTAHVDIPAIARRVVKEIGYDDTESGFNGDTCAVLTVLDEQSPDIAQGVNEALERRDGGNEDYDQTGAGDQGIMFGFACDETPELMPLPISLAHKLAKRLAAVRKDGTLPYLKPDGKTKVTVEYDGNTPVRVETVVVSTQHSASVELNTIREDMVEQVIRPIIPAELMDENTKVFVNPTGRFVVGGPHGDSGLTGRKIIVDTYGGYARHGGGAFSGKDPTKVDRSATYMARYAAKNVVAAGLAKRCEIQLAYAIGVARPVSVLVDTDGTGVVADEVLAEVVSRVFDFRPAAIIDQLGLRAPIYRNLAAYGHIGREDLDVAWEKTDRVEALKAALSDRGAV